MVAWVMAALMVMTAVALGYPFFVKTRRRNHRAPQTPDDLARRKTSIYRDIKELEFDRDMGKISDVDYVAMEADYKVEAMRILEMMDRSRRPQGKSSKPGAACPGCGRKSGAGARFCPFCGKALEGVCPGCGAPAGQEDRFCAVCGCSVLLGEK